MQRTCPFSQICSLWFDRSNLNWILPVPATCVILTHFLLPSARSSSGLSTGAKHDWASLFAKYLAPHCCLNYIINLPCASTEISILKGKNLEIFNGKTNRNSTKTGRISGTKHLHFSALFCALLSVNFALSVLFNNVYLFSVNQLLQHPWDEHQQDLYGLATPQILIIHAELGSGKFLLLSWLQTHCLTGKNIMHIIC